MTKFSSPFTRAKAAEYEIIINIMLRYIFDEDYCYKYPFRPVSFQEFLQSPRIRPVDSQLKDKILRCNISTINKIYQALAFVVANSYAPMPIQNAQEINHLFNLYYGARCPKPTNRRPRISPECALVFERDQYWRLYMRRMKYLEKHFNYVKCLLRKRKGIDKYTCNKIGDLLFPKRFVLRDLY